MRTIKFRAWHKKWNLMATEIEIGSTEAQIIVGNTGDILDINEEYSNLTFMQFTGLHDKKGKEIYEGDILTDHGDEGPLYVEYSIKHGAFCFVDKFDSFGVEYYTAVTISYEAFEVIGNIYENPGLLDQTS